MVSVLVAAIAAVHAAMTKDEVCAAIGWVGVILLSPVVGALIDAVVGINRIRRESIAAERSAAGHEKQAHLHFDTTGDFVAKRFCTRFAALKTLGDRITHHALTAADTIDVLGGGIEAYASMIEATVTARRSMILETYIFDSDPIGLRIAAALIEAVRRGVEVRVLIDAAGARYSIPSIVGYLGEGGISFRVFNGHFIMGLRLPYANLRTHRQILVVDGATANRPDRNFNGRCERGRLSGGIRTSRRDRGLSAVLCDRLPLVRTVGWPPGTSRFPPRPPDRLPMLLGDQSPKFERTGIRLRQ